MTRNLVRGEALLFETFRRSADIDRSKSPTSAHCEDVAPALAREIFYSIRRPEFRTTSLDPLSINVSIQRDTERSTNPERCRQDAYLLAIPKMLMRFSRQSTTVESRDSKAAQILRVRQLIYA